MIQKQKIINGYDAKKALKLLKMMIETPSVTGDESILANKTANFMEERGFDEVVLQEVRPEKFQTIGRIKGTGEGLSMMLCGHLDIFPPSIDMKDPYKAVIQKNRIFGAGVADMKAGTASTIMAADAVLQSNTDIEGDLIVALMMEEEIGGVGINHLLSSGVSADMGIVPESTNLRISTTGAGIAKFNISTIGKSTHVSNKEYGIDAIAKMTKVVESLQRLEFTYEPDPRVPKLPRLAAGSIIGGRGRKYDLRGAQNLSDFCSILVNVRFWKSQTVDTISADLEKMLDEIAKSDPEFIYELKKGYGEGPFETSAITRHPKDVPLNSPIVKIVKRNHEYITGSSTEFRSSTETVGNDDGANMNEAGIATITYGPGPGEKDLEVYRRLPLQARWIDLDTYHICGKVMALSSFDVCTKKG